MRKQFIIACFLAIWAISGVNARANAASTPDSVTLIMYNPGFPGGVFSVHVNRQFYYTLPARQPKAIRVPAGQVVLNIQILNVTMIPPREIEITAPVGDTSYLRFQSMYVFGMSTGLATPDAIRVPRRAYLRDMDLPEEVVPTSHPAPDSALATVVFYRAFDFVNLYSRVLVDPYPEFALETEEEQTRLFRAGKVNVTARFTPFRKDKYPLRVEAGKTYYLRIQARSSLSVSGAIECVEVMPEVYRRDMEIAAEHRAKNGL
jgi:hypothetical protein